MNLIVKNKSGKYEYTPEQFDELQNSVINIEIYSRLAQVFCDYNLSEGDFLPVLFLAKEIEKEAKVIASRF